MDTSSSSMTASRTASPEHYFVFSEEAISFKLAKVGQTPEDTGIVLVDPSPAFEQLVAKCTDDDPVIVITHSPERLAAACAVLQNHNAAEVNALLGGRPNTVNALLEAVIAELRSGAVPCTAALFPIVVPFYLMIVIQSPQFVLSSWMQRTP